MARGFADLYSVLSSALQQFPVGDYPRKGIAIEQVHGEARPAARSNDSSEALSGQQAAPRAAISQHGDLQTTRKSLAMASQRYLGGQRKAKDSVTGKRQDRVSRGQHPARAVGRAEAENRA